MLRLRVTLGTFISGRRIAMGGQLFRGVQTFRDPATDGTLEFPLLHTMVRRCTSAHTFSSLKC